MILVYISLFFFGSSLIGSLIVAFSRKKNKLKLETERKESPSIAVLIPARDESKVIESLLVSIENQTVFLPPKNIFVIVESETDATVEIVKKHHMNYFVRKKLHLKTKGYALQELIENLEEKRQYFDCYFIFDADNILENTFIEKMLEDYHQGYAVSTGYRKLKNKNHYFPISAGLTFFLVNELRNKKSIKYQGNIILSGTGYYIHGRLMKNWQTFPFHSLTEDYESSLYYTLHGISTHYREDAIFYDEQPTNYKQSITQRSRWIKGYFQNWCSYFKKFQKKRKEKPHNLGSITEMQIGILPVICIVLSLVFLLFYLLMRFCFSPKLSTLLFLLTVFLGLYLILVALSLVLLHVLKEKTTIPTKLSWQVAFYHPIFLLSYIHAFFKSLQKNLGWEKIVHGNVKKD